MMRWRPPFTMSNTEQDKYSDGPHKDYNYYRYDWFQMSSLPGLNFGLARRTLSRSVS